MKMKNLKEIDELIDIIFEREYYTNHGPELQKLERNLESYYTHDNVLGLSNYTIAFLIAILATNKKGKIMIPSILDASIKQAIDFKNLDYTTSSVDSSYGLINLKSNDLQNIGTIIINNTLGFSVDIDSIIKKIQNRNINLVILSKYGFGRILKRNVDYGILVCEIFDFNFSTYNQKSYGSIIRINDSEIAEKIRNIRSSYGSREKVEIPYTGNGRMSEMQAGLINISLFDFDEKIEQNKVLYKSFANYFNLNDNIEIIRYKKNGLTIPYYNKIIVKISKKAIKFKNILVKYKVYIKPLSSLDLVVDHSDTNAKEFLCDKYIISLNRFLSLESLKEFKVLLNSSIK
jgi:dTDP-4-amino-4,6-dideoxygalactose transaminase